MTNNKIANGLDERKCKICQQWKPLFEYPPHGTNGRLQYTCRDCQGKDAPIQPAEFVKVKPVTKTQLSDLCQHEDCDQPCMISSAGKLLSFCAEHQREHLAEIALGKLDPPRQPINLRDKIKPTPLYSTAMPAAESVETSELPAPTLAQRQAGFDRSPKKAKHKHDTQETILLCLVDHDTDEMVFITGRVTLRTQTHRDALLPGGFDALLDSTAEDGYLVIERGTPPVAPGIDSALAWRD